jgi:transcriptional regulator with XRE-family HTH domain
MLNQKLRTARLKKHWSMDAAASAVGVSKTTYLRWELGEQRPHGTSLQMLCDAFGATDEELGYGPAEAAIILLTAEEAGDLAALLKGESDMFDPSKRAALLKLLGVTATAITAPAALVAGSETWTVGQRVDPAALDHFGSLLKTCWELSNSGELRIAEQVIAPVLPRLIQLAPESQQAAGLASEALQLQSILQAHQLRIDAKISLCQQAVTYARQANNPNILVAGLAQLAVAYLYDGQFEKALDAYQDALRYSGQISPLLAARLYAEAASVFAHYGREREARFYIDLAYESFPALPEQDPAYLYADSPFAILPLYEGQAYLGLNRPLEAWNSFEKHAAQPTPERIRLEIINHQGNAALLMNDLDRYVLNLETGLAGAVKIGSQKRYNEALRIYQSIPAAWYKEPRIKTIAEQFRLQ